MNLNSSTIVRRIIGKQLGGSHENAIYDDIARRYRNWRYRCPRPPRSGSQLKAYSVSEADIIDPSAQATYLPAARKAIEAAHGRALRTAAGPVVRIEGEQPPKSAAINEWDSLDDAVAFYKSKEWTDLAPQRDKATKVMRRYVVEVEK